MQRNKHIIMICRVGLFSALLAVSAWIQLPFAVPITLQTFVLFLMAGALRLKESFAATAVYLGLGAVGLPVFSGFNAGFGVFLGPTGGFLLGFLPAVLISSYFLYKSHKQLLRYCAAFIGILIIYVCGASWYTIVYEKSGVWTTCILPFIIPDIIKITLAIPISQRLRKHIN